MKNFAIHNSHTALLGALKDLTNHLVLLGINHEQLPASIQPTLDYAKEVEEKNENDLSEWKEEFLQFFDHDEFNEVMEVDECTHLFLQSLKGSSDITYDLLHTLGKEYCVNIDLVMQHGMTKNNAIMRYLDLSNSHLSQATFQWLENLEEGGVPFTVAPYEYGMFISVTDSDDTELPDDLKKLLAYARQCNSDVIRLDRDADTVEELEAHDW